jgi:hypothetical protein
MSTTTTASTTRWTDRQIVLALVGFAGLVAVPFALFGPGMILDDWYIQRDAAFGGVFSAGDPDLLRARPGAWLVYALDFGALGAHPLPRYLIQVALNLAVVALLYVLLRRFLPQAQSATVTAVWVVLPNHTSLSYWASATNIVIAVALQLGGCLLLTLRPARGSDQILASACLVASALCYEATLPAAGVAVLAIPALLDGKVRWNVVLRHWLVLSLVFLWLTSHLHPVKRPHGWLDPGLVFPAHFGWGVEPDGLLALLATVVAAVGIVYAVVGLARPGMGVDRRAAAMVVAGLVVIAVGTAPFARYIYEPIGANDRVNAVASIGTALVWAGIGWLFLRFRPLVYAGAVVLGLGAMTLGVQRADLYATAGRDAARVATAVERAFPDADAVVVVGPCQLATDGVTGLPEFYVAEAAVQLRRGDDGITVEMTTSHDDFDAVADDRRFDMRPLSELDDDETDPC